jgi:HTH-type transcriptional regulator / antitoxin HigA
VKKVAFSSKFRHDNKFVVFNPTILLYSRRVLESRIILNERDARLARASAARMREFLASSSEIERAKSGLCVDVLNQHRKAVHSSARELAGALDAYERIKSGDLREAFEQWRHDPGVSLIIARVAKGLSQADLAEKLGLKEQQIQRYEAERYRSISLSNFRRIGIALGVRLSAELYSNESSWAAQASVTGVEYSHDDLKRVVKHARAHAWLDFSEGDEEHALLEYVSEAASRFGSPSLLRTGLNVHDLQQDLALLAWRTRIVERAEQVITPNFGVFDPLDIDWLADLARLSIRPDGPAAAVALLAQKGIVLVVEPQVPGLSLDGAALLVRGIPVIGMTLRHDRVDNFWFTLMHELGHIFLHYRTGLASGFFDDVERGPERGPVDAMEREANEFAGSVLIPPERWKTSSARISKSPQPIEAFAKQLGINPAIVFGRVRRERNDYKIFSNRVGHSEVRKWLGAT